MPETADCLDSRFGRTGHAHASRSGEVGADGYPHNADQFHTYFSLAVLYGRIRAFRFFVGSIEEKIFNAEDTEIAESFFLTA